MADTVKRRGMVAQVVVGESTAQIAARYGATVAPGVTVRRLPVGVSSRPYPVWDGSRLVCPDWKAEAERSKLAGIRRSHAARKRGMAQDAALMGRLIEMHGAGMRPPAIAAATGLKPDQVYRLLHQAGYRVERVNPGPAPATLQRLAEIRALVAAGKTRAEIAAQLGFAQVKYLGQFVQRHDPALTLPAVSRAMAPAAAVAWPGRWDGFREGQEARIRAMLAEGADEAAIGAALGTTSREYLRKVIRRAVPGYVPPRAQAGRRIHAERDDRVQGLIDRLTVREIAGQTGLTSGQVTASVRRLRKAGRIAPEVAEVRILRAGALPKGAKAARDRAILPLVADLSYAEIGVRLGLTAPQVKRSVRRLRDCGALPMDRVPMRPGSMNGTAPRKATPTAQILQLAADGATIERIAAETGAPRGTIRSVLSRAGRSAMNDRGATRAARLAELPVLVAEGLTGAEIAARWGVDVQYVYRMASGAKIGLGYNAASWNKGAVSPRVAARRALVADLRAKGATYAEMQDLLQVSMGTLATDIKALGLAGSSGHALSRRKGGSDADAERGTA